MPSEIMNQLQQGAYVSQRKRIGSSILHSDNSM